MTKQRLEAVTRIERIHMESLAATKKVPFKHSPPGSSLSRYPQLTFCGMAIVVNLSTACVKIKMVGCSVAFSDVVVASQSQGRIALIDGVKLKVGFLASMLDHPSSFSSISGELSGHLEHLEHLEHQPDRLIDDAGHQGRRRRGSGHPSG